MSKSSVDVIKSIHARGSQPLAKDFLRKYQPIQSKDRTESAIRKLHGTTLRANPRIDMAALSKMIRRSAMSKVSFPPQSDNAASGGAVADTGASNDWRDQMASTTKPTRIGGQVIGAPSKTNMQAAVDAIKQDLARAVKRVE